MFEVELMWLGSMTYVLMEILEKFISICQKIIIGGVYRLKHHLAGTQKDVGAC